MRNSAHQIVQDGQLRWRLNVDLAKEKGLTKEVIAKIRDVHDRKLQVIDCMEAMDPAEDMQFLSEGVKYLEECEYELQELWGFPKDARMHKFWLAPHCTCPQMDNEDDYGTGMMHIDIKCPLHGHILKELKAVEEAKAWDEKCAQIKKDNDKAAKWLMIFVAACCIFGLIAAGSKL